MRPRVPAGSGMLVIHRVGRAEIQLAMTRLADGDRSASTALIAALWPVLCAFAQRAVGNPADAEDIAQESLIKLATQMADFDASRDGLSWAFAIASFEVKTHLKRVTRRREQMGSITLEEFADDKPSPEQSLLDDDLEQALRVALDQLTRGEIEALEPVTTEATPALRKRRQRAMDRLKTVWRELYD